MAQFKQTLNLDVELTAEARRLVALNLAVDARKNFDEPEHIVERAQKFESYLRGDSGQEA